MTALPDYELTTTGVETKEDGTIVLIGVKFSLGPEFDRFTAAGQEMAAAWEAMPPKLREYLGPLSFTLDPAGSSQTEPS